MPAMESKLRNVSQARLVIDRIQNNDLLERLKVYMQEGADSENVIWKDKNAKLFLDIAGTRISCHAGRILIEISVTTDRKSDAKIVVPFRVGATIRDALRLGVTESRPRGDAQIAARWGKIIQHYLWTAIMEIGRENWRRHDEYPDKTLNALFAEKNSLVFVYSRNYDRHELQAYIANTRGNSDDYNPDPIDVSPPTRKPGKKPKHRFKCFRWLKKIFLWLTGLFKKRK